MNTTPPDAARLLQFEGHEVVVRLRPVGAFRARLVAPDGKPAARVLVRATIGGVRRDPRQGGLLQSGAMAEDDGVFALRFADTTDVGVIELVAEHPVSETETWVGRWEGVDPRRADQALRLARE